MNIFYRRQGQADINNCYFYTETIKDFRHLLQDDALKMIVVNSLKYLVDKELVTIYAYVIMPNHIHLIWYIHQPNGKESPPGSFAKFTAHQFKKQLLQTTPLQLNNYKVNKADRNYQFWKRDPLSIPLTTEEILLQKLNYIHNNPLENIGIFVFIQKNTDGAVQIFTTEAGMNLGY
jgi:REP element-mobilizing transposase RayT